VALSEAKVLFFGRLKLRMVCNKFISRNFSLA
jgi:hypothetical protein